jgi:hypothetical protein
LGKRRIIKDIVFIYILKIKPEKITEIKKVNIRMPVKIRHKNW